jgi:hypothetical protein
MNSGAVFSGRVDASLATLGNPIAIAANGGTLGDCILVANGSRDCITSGTAHSVALAGSLAVNTQISTNVTFTSGQRLPTVLPGSKNAYSLGSGAVRWATVFASTMELWGDTTASGATTRAQAKLATAWATSSDATRKGRYILSVYDTAEREALRAEANGTVALVGCGTTVVTTAKAAIQADADLITLVLRRNASGQTSNILEIQNEDGTSVLLAVDKNGNAFPLPACFNLAVGAVAATGTSLTCEAVMPFSGKIVKAWAYAKTGPTGADLIFDINLDGTTIWATQANRLKIVAGSQSGNTTTFDTTTFTAGQRFTIDIDQIGSTIPGQDITVVLSCLVKNQP